MLDRILRLVAEPGSADCALIAAQLGLSQGMVRSALEQLARQGYLQVVSTGCGRPCAACPVPAACLYRNSPRIWSLTPRGRRWLAKRAS